MGPCEVMGTMGILTVAQGASCPLQSHGTPWHEDLLPPHQGQPPLAWGSQPPPHVPAQWPCRYPRSTALTATEPAVLGHHLLVGREPAGLLGTGGEDMGVSAPGEPDPVPAMNNASPLPPTRLKPNQLVAAPVPQAPSRAGAAPAWGHTDPPHLTQGSRGARSGYLDG